jgi:hypothetical protein
MMEQTTVMAVNMGLGEGLGVPLVHVLPSPSPPGLGWEDASVSMTIAERVASFLNMWDLLAYISLDETFKPCGAVSGG